MAENTPQKGVYKFTITTQYPVESAVALFRVHYKIVKAMVVWSQICYFTLLRGETTDEVYVDHSADGILALMLESAEVQPGTDSEYNYEFKLLPIGWIS